MPVDTVRIFRVDASETHDGHPRFLITATFLDRVGFLQVDSTDMWLSAMVDTWAQKRMAVTLEWVDRGAGFKSLVGATLAQEQPQ